MSDRPCPVSMLWWPIGAFAQSRASAYVEASVEGRRVLLDDHHVVREQLGGDQFRVGAHGVRGVHGEHASADSADPAELVGQAAEQRRELGHLVGLGPDQPLGDHHRLAMGGCGQQVGDLPVGVPAPADRAADRLAVHRDRRQPSRPGGRRGDRADPGPGGQPATDPIGQLLRLQGVILSGQQPFHGVRVWRGVAALGVAAAAERGQHLLAGPGDPGGDVGQQHLPRRRRGRAQPQDRRQRVPDPTPITRIGDTGETLPQPTRPGPRQHPRVLGHQRHRRLRLILRLILRLGPHRRRWRRWRRYDRPSSRRDGDDRLHTQRSHRSGSGPSASPPPTAAPLPASRGHADRHPPVIITPGHYTVDFDPPPPNALFPHRLLHVTADVAAHHQPQPARPRTRHHRRGDHLTS